MSNKKNRQPGNYNQTPRVIEQPVEDNTESSNDSTVEETSNSNDVVVPKVELPVVEHTAPEELSEIEKYFKDIKASDNTELKNLLTSLELYQENMKPGRPVPFAKGAEYQYSLWKTILGLTSLPMDRFRKAWNLLLAFAETSPAFGDRYIHRFSEYWIWSQDELDAFQRIVNLIKLTSNVETRSIGLKQVSLERSLDKVFSQESKQNIVTFYS